MFKKIALAATVIFAIPFLNPDFRKGFKEGFAQGYNENKYRFQ